MIVREILREFNLIEITTEDYIDSILYILPKNKDKIGARDSIIIKNCIDYNLALLTFDKNLKAAAEEMSITIL